MDLRALLPLLAQVGIVLVLMWAVRVWRGQGLLPTAQAPSRFVNRDWIVITGEVGDRLVQLAISHDNLADVWQALAGTGAVVGTTEVPLDHLNRPSGRPFPRGPLPRLDPHRVLWLRQAAPISRCPRDVREVPGLPHQGCTRSRQST